MAVKTYQDLLEVGERKDERMEFVKAAIKAHKASPLYRLAVIAYEYAIQQSPTMINFQKFLHKVTGEIVPDTWSANYKLCSNIFDRLITQLVQFELGNGVTWGKPTREISAKRDDPDCFSEEVWDEEQEAYVEKWFLAGTDRKVGLDFDQRLQEIFYEAIACGTSFGFWNLDHVEMFTLREFVPMYDEENGALMAGIRFWQVADNKPLRATLYEPDGYTDYMWKNSEGSIIADKRAYKMVEKSAPIDPTKTYDGENYEGFPIIPAWGNKNKISALVGLRENIDCFDLIKSGFANTVDDASVIYWILQNADGMDEIDLAKFQDVLRRTHTAMTDSEGATAEARTLDVPYQSREALLQMLRSDIYEDFMALDTKNISNGATTATQIQAAYDPMNSKADKLEYCILDFIQKLLKIAGLTDRATFTRSVVVNKAEEVNVLMQGAAELSDEYVTKKLLTILGDADMYDTVMRQKEQEEMERIEINSREEEAEESGETGWTEGTEKQNNSSES